MTKTVTRFGLYSFAIFSLALTGCPSPKATSIPEVPNPLKNPKDRRARPIQTDIQRQYDALDGVSLSAKQACAVDICGPIGEGVTAADIQRGRVETTEESARVFNLKIAPALDALEAIEVEQEKALLRRMRESEGRIKQTELSGNYRVLLNILFMFGNIGEALQAQQSGGITKLRELTPKLTEEDRQHLLVYATAFANSARYKELGIFGQVGLDDGLTALGKAKSAADLPAARKQYANELKEKIEIVSATFPTLEIKPSKATIAVAKGQDVSSLASEQITSDVAKAMLADFLNVPLFAERDPKSRESIQKFYSSKLSQMEAKAAAGRDTADRSKADNECQLTVDQITAMNLNPSDVTNFKELTEKVRNQAIRTADALVSPTVQSKVRAVLESVNFNFPATSRERIDYLASKMKESIRDAQARDPLKFSESDLAMYAAMGAFEEEDSADEASDLGSDCVEMQPEPISDYSLTGHGKINISWQTVKFPETGVGVLGHEFGHVTSKAIQDYAVSEDADYKRIKSCTDTRHGSQLGRTNSEEEDFADVFASQILKAIGGDQKNIACILLGNTESRYGQEAGLSLKHPTGGSDTHSPNFFRLIAQEVDAGRGLSQSCRAVIAQGLPSMNATCSR